jgi:hypothetical protein
MLDPEHLASARSTKKHPIMILERETRFWKRIDRDKPFDDMSLCMPQEGTHYQTLQNLV